MSRTPLKEQDCVEQTPPDLMQRKYLRFWIRPTYRSDAPTTF